LAYHARKSASGSKRWIECPGSLALEASLAPELRRPTNEAAMTGTCAHALGEHCLLRGFKQVPEELHGVVIALDPEEDAVIDVLRVLDECDTAAQVTAATGDDCKFMARADDKMVEGVNLYLETVWADRAEMGTETEMYVERRFDLSWLRPDMGGTSDCTLYEFMGLLRVIDYKNGFVPVEVEGNTQGLYYALGMAHEVEWLFEEVEVVIVQPNSRDGGGVRRYRISKAELEAFRDKLEEASDRVDAAGEELARIDDETGFYEWAAEFLSTGEDGGHCTFCDALPTCPAAKWSAERVAMADFADVPPDGNEFSMPEESSLSRLEQVLRWGPFLDKLVSAANELGQRRLEQGLDVPGHKLVAGKANRVYCADDDEILSRMAAAGFKGEQVYEAPKPRKVKSPAQLEKLGKEAKRLVNGVARENPDGTVTWEVEPLAIKPQGKLTMAPLADPRPAVTVGTAADDFAGVE
jgi:hypothetical protein